MIQKYIKTLNGASVGTLTGLAFLLLVSNYLLLAQTKESLHSAASLPENTVDTTCVDCMGTGSTTLQAEAQALYDKLSASGGMLPGVPTLMKALTERDALLSRSVTITATDPKQNVAPATWTVSLKDHPTLVSIQTQWTAAAAVINEKALADLINQHVFDGQKALTSIVVSDTTSDGKVTRAQNVPVAHDGYLYNSRTLAAQIVSALKSNTQKISVTAAYKKSEVTLSMNGIKKQLSLLSYGESDFSDSPEERVWNVHKAINERVNNVIVKPGETFSFVDTLGGPVTLDKGWREGLGLFGGGAALTPGAGICQAATTVYRAALLAGFPIVEKRNHSMWVPHYEPYGAGLDATVFPGFHDLRFKNNSTSTILIQAYTHGQEVTVNIYGTSDNRSVTLDGPYFWNTKPRAGELRPLGKDEIGWVSHVTYADGKKVDTPLIATYYKGIPRSVMKKYAGLPGSSIMHALVGSGGTLVVAAQ